MSQVSKKKAGRPRKEKAKPTITKEGISNEPYAHENVMELVYDNPIDFKKLFGLFKSMAVSDIVITFTESCAYISTKDHSGMNIVYTTIEGSKMIRYYCKKRLEVNISSKATEKILESINKDYSLIVLCSKAESTNSKLYIIMKNENLEVEDVHEILLNTLTQNDDVDPTVYLRDEVDYKLHFELPSKWFKKIIADYTKNSLYFSIEKEGSGPLHFCYESDTKKSNLKSFYKNPEKIKLRHSIEEDDVFSVSAKLEAVKQFSSSLIADEIKIAADPYKKLIFTLTINNGAIIVKILTSINTHL
nr:proliferating cell nuclear antigen-like protein [Kaumoebavirus]